MRARANQVVAIALAIAALSYGTAVQAQQSAAANPSHTHIGHVSDGFRDTPRRRGLLPTARAEAAVVAQHAGLMANASDDLEMMQRHAGHVLNAIDPTVEKEGPGLGYGLKKAAEGVVNHVNLAANADGATQNVKTHARYVAAVARNTVERAEKIEDLAQQIKAATSAEDAAKMATELKTLADQLIPGFDANEDGEVGAQDEGGLAMAATHMTLMKQGEGMFGGS